MNSATSKKVEFLIDIAIIVTLILTSAVLIKTYFFINYTLDIGSNIEHGNQVRVGMKLFIPDIDWARNGQTLLLALSSECHFCSESAPLYRRLAQEQRAARLIAVLPQEVSTSEKYLNNLGVSVDGVHQSPLDSIGVTGTPTLILVDNAGLVKGVWSGKLPSDQESKLLSLLQVSSKDQ